MESLSMTIPMKATEQYFPLVLFVMRYKLVLNMKSEDEILKWGRSLPELVENDSKECEWNPKSATIQMESVE